MFFFDSSLFCLAKLCYTELAKMSLLKNMAEIEFQIISEQSWILLKVIRKMNQQILKGILQLSFVLENKENIYGICQIVTTFKLM